MLHIKINLILTTEHNAIEKHCEITHVIVCRGWKYFLNKSKEMSFREPPQEKV